VVLDGAARAVAAAAANHPGSLQVSQPDRQHVLQGLLQHNQHNHHLQQQQQQQVRQQQRVV
jgi:hypothetical protein